ncbi:NUDIX domain-containing protein [Paenibacillus sp. HN-1]|uniref:NUDIX hydrolase n=1 Tax=Paenibacillus TaxID=44249 RepID=UPI001CA7B8DF|nr:MULTISPECIES: NUDIX domain-containing protein [Paenibacillus]MBY9080220.1 NUDIX domain-containing protein [Paenibacillus sp. CGMCC 1.18879]MBY9083121.1 NUDIX domain-containing protein [Paenibacillus sinensis]
MKAWYGLDEIQDEAVTFAVILTKLQGGYLIIKNRKRGGWEIPGGRREPGETILETACRELHEETGALGFDIAPFGVFPFNDTYGMAFTAEVIEMGQLPEFEIEETRRVDELPDTFNFGSLFYILDEKLNGNASALNWTHTNLNQMK